MSTHIHIERLVLDGIQVDRTASVRQSLARELTRLVREGGLSHELHQSGAMSRLHAGSIAVDRGPQGVRFGTQIASAVYRGLGRNQ